MVSTQQAPEQVRIRRIDSAYGKERHYELARAWSADGVVHVEPAVRLDSVTALTGNGLPKPWLENWLKSATAKKAYELRHVLVALGERDEEGAAIDMLTGYPDRVRDHWAERGTAVHRLIDRAGQAVSPEEAQAVLDGAEPELRHYLRQYRDCVDRMRITIEHLECPCWSVEHGYAGTLDAIATMDGERGVLDVKTGRVYPEAALQVAAYRFAEYLLPRDAHVPLVMAELGLTTGWLLDLKPDSWKLTEVAPLALEEAFGVFLNARAIAKDWRGRDGLEARVLGQSWDGAAPIEDWAA